jgi:hypothetical protein
MDSVVYLLTQIGFGLVTIAFFYLLLVELRKGLTKSSFNVTHRKKIFLGTIAGLLIWIFFVSFWSVGGKMGDFDMFPLNVMPILAVPFITILIITFSKTFKEIIIHIPQQNIIRLQSFRIFVEILLWALFITNLAPIQMTFEGLNFDILSGISAPVIAYLISKRSISKTGIVIWNLVCLGLLINIVTVAIISMPTPLRIFMNDPSNTIVTQFPISFLPGLLVPFAYSLHFFSLRQLALKI